MSPMQAAEHPSESTGEPRILIVDDDRDIHGDFERVLARTQSRSSVRAALDLEIFGASDPIPPEQRYGLSHAYQGREALALVQRSVETRCRFALAFIDMRMPPGWDGAQTIEQLWRVDPAINCVMCTAYSDFSWEETLARTGRTQGLHLLRKPFQAEQVLRFASVLCQKWMTTPKDVL
jgi:CheY-like chemotaxis protein